MRKKKEYDDIHIPFIVKELIIIFIVVTFHWVFISFSASDIQHPEPVRRPLAKTLSADDLPARGSPPVISSSSKKIGESLSVDALPVPAEPRTPSQQLLGQMAGGHLSPSPSVASSGRSDRSNIRQPSSTATGGSSVDGTRSRVRRELIPTVQRESESPSTLRRHSPYEIPEQPEPSVKTHKRTLVLSNDGGGYRALFGAEYVKGFLNRSQEIRGGLYPDRAEHEATDLRARARILAGTSAGGVNTLSWMMMNQEGGYKYSLDEVVEAYPGEAKKIFDVDWKKRLNFGRGVLWGTFYDKKNVREVLQEKFYDTHNKRPTKFSELGRADQSLLILAANPGANLTPKRFRSWEARRRPVDNFEAWQVGISTTAAPVYFGDAEFVHNGQTYYFRDGGVYANNPAFHAFKEVELLKPWLGLGSLEDILFLSIGTGLSSEFIDPRKTQNNAAFQSGIGAIVNAQMSAADAATELFMREALIQHGFKYHRVQPMLPQRRKKLDRHGKGQTRFFYDLAKRHLDEDKNTIDLVRDLDEEIPDLPDKSVRDTTEEGSES